MPEGLPTRATIGSTGGTLASSDGRLTIAVPAGALTSDTVIGIQPITATAPGALGSAYRLTPEATVFAQPVTLAFTYSAGEAGAAAPSSLRVATHEASGRWTVASATRDAAQNRIAVTTTHFSDWSFIAGLQLAPAAAVVLVKEIVPVEVIGCDEAPNPAPPATAPVLRACHSARGTSLTKWSVNAIPGGNTTVGTISNFGLPGTDTVNDYFAPAVAPAQNPVAVSAEYTDELGTTTFVSNIKVVDQVTAYEGTAFGRIVISAGGQEQFFETSANLRFVRNAELSHSGVQWYDGTGTAFVHGRPFGCGEGGASAPVQGAVLTLNTAGSLAGTYSIAGGAVATATMTCGNPPQVMTGPFLIGSFGASGTDICPSLPIGNDPGRLSGSWFCNLAAGSTGRSNWTLRAVE